MAYCCEAQEGAFVWPVQRAPLRFTEVHVGPILFDPSDDAYISLDWSTNLAEGVTLAGVVHSVDAPLSIEAEQTASPVSLVRVKGAKHGGMYMVSGQGTLSTGEKVNRQWPIRGWNS